MPEIGRMHRDDEGIIELYGSDRGILIKTTRHTVSGNRTGLASGTKIDGAISSSEIWLDEEVA